MRLRCSTSVRHVRVAPPRGLSTRYIAVGMLIVLASCTASQPASQFTPLATGRAVRGFQIQIHSTLQKDAAEDMVRSAEQWWAGMGEEEQRKLFGLAYLPVEIKWHDPYYRVRIGNFRSREQAREVLDSIATEFPAAFIVPETFL